MEAWNTSRHNMEDIIFFRYSLVSWADGVSTADLIYMHVELGVVFFTIFTVFTMFTVDLGLFMLYSNVSLYSHSNRGCLASLYAVLGHWLSKAPTLQSRVVVYENIHLFSTSI